MTTESTIVQSISKATAMPTKEFTTTPTEPSQSALYHTKISDSDRTPFEKQVWHLLLQIPTGSYTTYGIIAAALHTSPRAVGNALRRNPFSPQVPCHRVVSTARTIGGFKGATGEDSGFIVEKRGLLQSEGVRFDEKGRVLGSPFEGFDVQGL